ncbi:hypothetical protein [Streptomyces sp. NPDC007063]|uniref:hypothetical protein n=1 Tax=Streptomyces sp. NPDC007063 TaxID=3364772 RepID=UPI00367AD171
MNNQELYRALGLRRQGARVTVTTPDGTKHDIAMVRGTADDTIITLTERTEPDDPRVEKIARALCADDACAGDGGHWESFADSYRRNARAVLAVLDADEDKSPAPLAVGDHIRILKNGLSGARVYTGDVLRVTGVYCDAFVAFADDAARGTWTFNPDDEGTGWERA